MSRPKVTIEHSNSNGHEYGYGLYINAVAANCIYASERVSKNATPAQIKAAEKRVRAKANRILRSEPWPQ